MGFLGINVDLVAKGFRMSKEMICPFCGQNLRQSKHQELYTGQNPYFCDTHDCYSSECCVGTKELWQALIQSQRDLQTAVQALKDIQTAQGRHWGATDTDIKTDCKYYARKALEQIEHKE